MSRLCKEMGISDTFLANLKSNKIFTVSDYIQEETEKLSNICNTTFKVRLHKTNIRNYINGIEQYNVLRFFSFRCAAQNTKNI